MPASVELGEFSCYEIKSCMEDFTSGHGLTFYGDVNYLVTTRELAEQLRVTYRLPRNINQVLTPSKKATSSYRSSTCPANARPTGAGARAKCCMR
ncbi:MAG: hypothetical protein ACLR5C_05005 [Bifidobacterium adolescentis]